MSISLAITFPEKSYWGTSDVLMFGTLKDGGKNEEVVFSFGYLLNIDDQLARLIMNMIAQTRLKGFYPGCKVAISIKSLSEQHYASIKSDPFVLTKPTLAMKFLSENEDFYQAPQVDSWHKAALVDVILNLRLLPCQFDAAKKAQLISVEKLEKDFDVVWKIGNSFTCLLQH